MLSRGKFRLTSPQNLLAMVMPMLFLAAVVFQPSSAKAQQCIPGNNDTVTICAPAANSQQNNPVFLEAAANTNLPVQKFLFYIDNNLVYQDTSGSRVVSTYVNLTAGQHYFVAQFYNGAWVKASEYFSVVSGGGCVNRYPPPSITICSPPANSNVPNPVQIQAIGNSGPPIQKFLVYVDNNLVYQVLNSNMVNTQVNLTNGQHHLVLQFYNGSWIFASEYFTVGSGGGIVVTVTPSSATVPPNGTQQFTAHVSGSSNTSVTWSVDGVNGGNSTVGTISSTGLYTAPSMLGTHTVKATSVADPTKYGTATVTVANPGSTSVLTYHNNDTRSGANTTETILNPSNVNSNDFGKKVSYSVDGQIYAQPLYVPNMSIGGAHHNVVFVATENDTVYAFDADSGGGPIWQKHLGTPPANNDSEGISPILGITSTPVIDTSTGTMYVLTDTEESGARKFRLHAMDVTTGNEKFGGPVIVTGTVNGTGWDNNNGHITLESGCYQRSALALVNNNVYIGFGHCSHGWLLSYNKATLQQTAILNTTPNGAGGALWGGGGTVAVDSNNDLFIITGVDINDPASGYNDSVLRLSSNNLSVLDYFKPANEAWLRQNDADFGSGADIVMPDNSSQYPHEVIGAGKDGRIFVMNRDNLGGYQQSDHVIQVVQTGRQQFDNVFSTPAFWNGNIYYHCEQDVIKAYSWNNGLLSNAPTSQGSHTVGVHGATASVSANGNVDGIVWEIESTGQPNSQPAILRAYDALNLSSELYDSTQAGSRDTAGPAVKFTVPTVADGHVFVGTGNQLDVYGLLH